MGGSGSSLRGSGRPDGSGSSSGWKHPRGSTTYTIDTPSGRGTVRKVSEVYDPRDYHYEASARRIDGTVRQESFGNLSAAKSAVERWLR